jgi:outer membrane immunogenic protein
MRAFRATCIGFVVALGLTTSVNADGMRRGCLKDCGPPPPPPWAGVYIGAHLGGAWSDVDWRRVTDTSTWFDSSDGTTFGHDLNGWVGGGQIGYNWQRGPWVFGAEVAFSGTGLDGSSRSTVSTADDTYKTEIDSLFTVVARLGYTWDRWLAYAKAGYAGADVKFSASDVGGAAPTGSTSFKKFADGYTLGAGVEYMFAPRVTFAVDYSFVS